MFVVVSRPALIESRFSTVICAPIYSSYAGLSTQVAVSLGEGLKHESSIHCDELVSLPKTALTNVVGTLPSRKLNELKRALRVALDVED